MSVSGKSKRNSGTKLDGIAESRSRGTFKWVTRFLGILFVAIGGFVAASSAIAAYPSAQTGGVYMFNYYLPPAGSSTPWWPSWSPDGLWLAFAMDGTLWRMRVNDYGNVDGVAEELVREPWYLSSPEWSPDGRYLAYTADDDGRSINLRLLDLTTGKTIALTTGDDVNVEPAWSPDSRRLAYVSTAPTGYFNIRVAEVEDGRLGTTTQVTTDCGFGRNRLYFGEIDANISPSWSPDGRELLFVSNHGILLGSGGVWRAPIEADVIKSGKARLIRQEETLYRTRPQWSPDGKRFVYASHLGGQFTNLFVLPAVGGEPYKMTFGEHDTFSPRWSPDGEWIACISNEEGLPQLKLLKAWGGDARLLRIARKQWKQPMGTLDVSIVDASSGAGQEVAARVYQRASDGKPYTPDDAYERIGPLNRRLFHSQGHYRIEAPPGAFTIEAVRGFEYEVAKKTVEVKPGQSTHVTLRLQRMDDLKAKGWYSGSNHVHMNYGGNLHNTPENMMLMIEAEDTDVACLLVANKDNRVLDYQYYIPGQEQHPASTRNRVLHVGQEYRPAFYGHLTLLNLKEHLISPFTTGYEGTGIASLYPSNTDILEDANKQGGIGAYAHPFTGDMDPLTRGLGGAKALPVDVALGTVSYHELWSQSAGEAALNVWFRLLNCGFRIPVTGGEDSISNLHRVELVGSVRGYFHLGSGALSWGTWVNALLAGRGFVTNGPLLEFSANDGIEPGEEIALATDADRVTFRGTLKSNAPLQRLELVSNGRVVRSIPLAPSMREAAFEFAVPVTASSWWVLRATGAEMTFPVENSRPMAITNPIYITVRGLPVRDRSSAEYFVKWIDLLAEMAGQDPGWRSEQEKQHVLGQFKLARDVYLARAMPAARLLPAR